MKKVVPPFDWLSFFCNILFVAAFLAAFGQLVISQCAKRKLHRDLLDMAKIGDHKTDNLTHKEGVSYDMWGKIQN